LCSATKRKPSGLKQGPGWVKEIAGAKRFTSSAVRFLVRSVTAHRSVLRVPTKTTPLDGPTAMWRASGTMA